MARAEGFDGFFNCVAAWMAQVAVNRVGGQRMVGFAHMNADLVGATGFERAFDVAVCQITFQNFDVGNGRFAAEFDDCHFQAVVRIAADLGFDFAVKRNNAVGDCAVNAFDCALLQLLNQ